MLFISSQILRTKYVLPADGQVCPQNVVNNAKFLVTIRNLYVIMELFQYIVSCPTVSFSVKVDW
jgi:hypothetical protein